MEGKKEVVALRACAEESKDGWSCLLHDVRQRGATQIDLIVTDGHEGILSAVAALFGATPRRRCVVHKQRNVMNAIVHRERKEVSAELSGIFKQERKEDALLNLVAFKAKYQKRYPEGIRTSWASAEAKNSAKRFPVIEVCFACSCRRLRNSMVAKSNSRSEWPLNWR